jgi:6-pyruvoyl-tetrahydropterin synthase
LRYTVRAVAHFSTTHKADEPLRCHFLHGHDFEVTAEVTHDLLDDGVPRGARGFDLALAAICDELDERPLDEMAPGINRTHTGIAAYIFERLAAQYAGLSSVSVDDGRYLGGVGQ